MPSRIYTSVVSVGNINIYNVVADPNGVLTAPLGSLAVRSDTAVTYQNTDGGTTWIVLGSGVVPATPVRTLGEDQGTTGVKILPVVSGAAAKTVVFTAPIDMTLKNLIFEQTLIGSTGTIFQTANLVMISTMVVAGSGPDVGSIIDGFGIHGAVFASTNIGDAPELNIRLAAGDTITMDFWNLSGEDSVNYSCSFTYVPGLGATPPKRFIGAPVAPGAFGFFSTASVAATGSLTVVTAPLAAGDTVILENGFLNGFDETFVGGTLTGVAGARTPGSNDFDATTPGTVTAMRDEILAALSDPANQWDAGWTFAASGVDSIDITRKTAGAIGNSDMLSASTTPAGGITVSGSLLTGGVSPIDSVAMATPTVAMTLEKVYISSFFPATQTPPLLITVPPEFVNIEINADPAIAGVGPVQMPNDSARVGVVTTEPVALAPADTIDITGRSAAGPGLLYLVVMGQT